MSEGKPINEILANDLKDQKQSHKEDIADAKLKAATKPAAKAKSKKPKIQMVRFKNVHNKVVKIVGATIRPGEMSKSYTIDQAAIVKHSMKPYLDASWLKEIKV